MPRRIRVLFLAKDASRGGTMRELGYVLKYLDKQRFEPVVLLSRGGDLIDEYRQHAAVHVIKDHPAHPQSTNSGTNESRRPGLLEEFRQFRDARRSRDQEYLKLRQIVGSFGPDILVWHYHFPIGVFDSLQELGLPGIQHVQQRFAALAAMSDKDLARFFSRAQMYVCEGNGVRDELHTLAGIPLGNIHVIPMPFDGEQLAQDSRARIAVKRADLGIPETTILVGIVASILFVKAPDLLLKAARHLRARYPEKDIRFLWIGGLPYMFKNVLGASVISLATEYGVSETVYFLGDKPDVYPYLKLLDIYAHPARMDAFPHAVLEAMALNLPAVTFRQGLAEEQFAQDTMLVAENFDPVALAEAIVQLANSPTLRQELGERGSKLIHERYDAKKNIPMYERLLEQTIQNTPG